jgi:beta-lactamase regulating signal transducer with metallopeptidase domain
MNLFFQINLMLSLTGMLFVLSEKCLSICDVRISSIKALRFSQILFVLSILVPIVLKALPSEAIKGVPSNAFQVYSDGMTAPASDKNSTLQVPTQHSTQIIEKPVYVPNYSLILISLWIIGVCYFISKFLKNYLKIKHTLQSSIPLKQNGRIKIVTSSKVFVPFSVRLNSGIWIVIPESLLGEKKDLDLAIKHEMQHHRQGDTWWAILMEFLGCFFFFNPAMYMWKNIITELQEFSCDESLTGQNKISSQDYGSCLLRVAEAALEHRHMYAGTTSMAAIIKDSNYFKKFLMRRIEMITEEKKSRRNWIAVSIGVLTLIVSLATAVGAEKLVRGKNGINAGTVNVDKDVQKIADDVLTRALSRMKATAGFIIVSEPSTGRILAVANMDLKTKRKGHWVLNELMETASIAKPLVVAEAIDSGKTDLSTVHNCENGKYNYNGTVYRDWKTEGWPQLTTSKAMEVSSNICAIKIAQTIGEDGLDGMLNKFGFGEGGIAQQFPEARAGERPPRGPQFIPQITQGFGFKSSPLEILQAYGALINGGMLMEPVSDIGNKKSLRKVLSKESSEKMRQILQNVVLHGTGKQAQSDLYSTAGKTATSLLNDFMNIEWFGSKNMANYAGFIGFAPVNNPAIEVYVGIINPNTDNTGAHGGSHAAPVFKEVIENVLTHLKVAPDKI